MLQKGIPESIARLINELSKLPGIGEKNATRLAFHIFRSSRESAENLSKAITDAKTKVVLCETCFNFATESPCELCRDEERDHSIICVVEDPLDQLAIERSREYRGVYHILHGVISPIEGVGPEDLRIKELIRRLEGGRTKEIIIATNPSVEGEATALYLSRLVKPMGIGVSRIAHGIPMGGDIEYIDEITLSKAIRDRRYI
ncbi:MAG TPA: recombination mediator RecR [Thermodesulfobacteriota bacterium]|nr:recombination mediator RecR [Thermodesulfobacteriota bacterium]